MGRISSFIVGSALGAVAALMLTKKTGEEMRSFVTEKASAVANEAKDLTKASPEEAINAIKGYAAKGQEVASSAVAKGQEYAQQVSQQATDFAKNAQTKSQEFMNQASQQAQDFAKAAQEKGAGFMSAAQERVQGAANQATEAFSANAGDDLREKIEAARQRIAAQVVANSENSQVAPVEAAVEAVVDATDASQAQ